MAIGRVAGPMLLSELDRQGIDLTFTTNNSSLVSLDFTDFRMILKGGSGGPYTFNINGNSAIGNVVLEAGALVTTQGLNQNLTLQANGIANVTVINANVISGRVDGTVVGGLNPVTGTFTYLNATTLSTLAFANVSNLRANNIPFTNATNTYLVDNNTFKFFTANNRLIVANLTVTEQQTFTTLDTGNIIVRNSNPTSIPYVAANNWIITTPSLVYYSGNNLVRTGNIQLDNTNTNQVLFVDSSENKKVKGTDYLTFDGVNLRANGITRLGSITFFNNSIGTANTNEDLKLAPDGSGVISAEGAYIRNLPNPVQASDAATKDYVDGLITVSTASTNTIFQGDTYVQVRDDNQFTANIVFVTQGAENGRIENGIVQWQDITIVDNIIATQAGALILSPDNNNRVEIQTTKSLKLPVGDSTTRPVPGFEFEGDLRYNTEISNIEWFNGTEWSNPQANTVFSQTIIPDGTNNQFTLAQEATTDSILVNFNGVIQKPSTTYSVALDQITFSTVPLVTDIIEIRFFAGSIARATNPIVADALFANVAVTATDIDQWDTKLYRGAKYTYTAKTLTGNNYEIGDLKVVHDGIEGFYSSTFVSKAGTTMVTWTTYVDPVGILFVRAAGSQSDVKVKFHAIYLTDPI